MFGEAFGTVKGLEEHKLACGACFEINTERIFDLKGISCRASRAGCVRYLNKCTTRVEFEFHVGHRVGEAERFHIDHSLRVWMS
jgi:hypothetical protein